MHSSNTALQSYLYTVISEQYFSYCIFAHSSIIFHGQWISYFIFVFIKRVLILFQNLLMFIHKNDLSGMGIKLPVINIKDPTAAIDSQRLQMRI